MHLRILNPCPMKWDELTATGDFGLRACEKCHKNVKDLTGLAEADAIAYVRAAQARGQRVCGRAEVRNGRLVFVAAAAAIMASVATVSGCSAEAGDAATGEEQTPSSPAAAAAPTPECEGGACQEAWMGDVDIAQ